MDNISLGTEEDIETLNKYIIEFNLQQLPFPEDPPWKTLVFTYKVNESIMGGIYGYLVMNNVLKIDVLYVKKAFRHRQLGRSLLEKIESEAKNKGAYLSQLETYDFQALEFYQKNGYEIYGILENCPAPGHRRYSLKKDL